MLGILELLVILFIIILVYGARRVARLGGRLGRSILGFKREPGDTDTRAKSGDRPGGRPHGN